MANLKFRTFTWPNNPSTFILNNENRIIKHEFPEVDGAETEELGLSPRTFSGTGVFYGKNAYSNFKKLMAFNKDGKTGTLVHPKYGKFTVRLSKLTSKEEPLPNWIEYDFEFIEHTSMKIISKKTPPKKDKSKKPKSLKYPYPGILKRGSKGTNVKRVQEVVGVKVDGIFGPKTEAAVKTFQKKNGLTVDGIVGPKTWDAMFGEYDNKTNTKAKYHTVVSGDTLSKLALKYYKDANKWKKIADANKKLVKNPHQLKIGWKLLIP